MCGISGFFDPSGNLSEKDLRKINNSLAHRGPDAQGLFIRANAGLGHRRLSIIDPSTSGHQPMSSCCGRYVITYNGEVYNFRELLVQIRQQDPDYSPYSGTDTEIVLKAFTLWGKEFVNRLNGMFAMAIYDLKNQEMHLWRDRIGIKPLYYYYNNDRFVFASELKSLVKPEDIAGELTIDNNSVNFFLHLGYIPAPHTIYKQVKKLEAGSYALVNNDGISIRKWYSFESKLHNEVISCRNQALKELENLLESSVRYRLISDVTYGTFLSGGIDSSLVTAFAQKVNNKPIDTFTIGFSDQSFDESHFAKKISAHLGTCHHELFLSEKQVLDWLPVFFETYDEPFADSSGIPSLMISSFASEKVKMTLSGDGGDELFLGYGAYIWANRLRKNYPLWSRKIISELLKKGNHRMQRASSVFLYENTETKKSHIFSQEQYCFTREEIRRLVKETSTEISLKEELNYKLRVPESNEQQALFDLHYYLPDDLLVKTDRATMAFALETRVPLLDYRIVEFALNLHPSLKIHNGNTKWLLKELLAKHIPVQLFNRPKKGFAIPLSKWLQKELKFLADEYLSDESVKEAGILNLAEVRRLLYEFYNLKKTFLYQRIWLLIVLQRWIIDRKTQLNIN